MVGHQVEYNYVLTLDGSFEKGFASFARGHAVVKAGRHITADETHSLWTTIIIFDGVL